MGNRKSNLMGNTVYRHIENFTFSRFQDFQIIFNYFLYENKGTTTVYALNRLIVIEQRNKKFMKCIFDDI